MNPSSQPGTPSHAGLSAAPQLDLLTGTHLDPDQLSALLEGALPEPERLASMRHLAECAGCRELAFLAQSANPDFLAEREAAQATPALQPSFWESLLLLWKRPFAQRSVALGALACCLLGIFLFQLHTRSKSEQPPSVATVRPAEAPPKPAPSPASTSPPSTGTPSISPHQNEPESRQITGWARSIPRPEPPAQPALVPPAFGSPAPKPLARRLAEPKAAPLPATTPVVAGNAVRDAPESLPMLNASRSAAAPLKLHGGLAKTAASSASAPPEPIEPPEAQAVPAAAPVPLGVAGGNASGAALPAPAAATGQASDTAAITVTNAAVSAQVAVPAPALLPSKLPSRASAATGKHRLELDTAGTLFYSNNGGKHWKRVKPTWPGIVQTLQLTPHPQSEGARFQITTSTGAVWLSPDGRHWSPR